MRESSRESVLPILLDTAGISHADGSQEFVLTFDRVLAADSAALTRFYVNGPDGHVKLTDPLPILDGNMLRIQLPEPFEPGSRVMFASGTIDTFIGWAWPGYTEVGRGWFDIPALGSPPEEDLQLDRWAEALRWTPTEGLDLHFSEPIQRGAGQIVIRFASGEVVATLDVQDEDAVEVQGVRLSVLDPELLLAGGRYVVELSAGAVQDAEGHSSVALSTTRVMAPNQLYGKAGGAYILGTPRIDDIHGDYGYDTAMGGGDDDVISYVQLAVYRGRRSEYRLETHEEQEGLQAKSFAKPPALSIMHKNVFHTIQDQVVGRDGKDTLSNVHQVWFEDYSVDLLVGSLALTAIPNQLRLLQELYVAFFARIPEASGLTYWIKELRDGDSLESMADRFHEAGVAFGVYEEGTTDNSFITALYANVLGRGPGSATAPGDNEIGFWRGLLESGTHTRGGIVLKMLQDVHTCYEGDATYGFVGRLLDNRVALAQYYAVEQGLSRHTQAEDIAFGKELAALVTPDDISAAIALVGVEPTSAG